MLPSKEGYMLPINKTVFDELEDTIKITVTNPI